MQSFSCISSVTEYYAYAIIPSSNHVGDIMRIVHDGNVIICCCRRKFLCTDPMAIDVCFIQPKSTDVQISVFDFIPRDLEFLSEISRHDSLFQIVAVIYIPYPFGFPFVFTHQPCAPASRGTPFRTTGCSFNFNFPPILASTGKFLSCIWDIYGSVGLYYPGIPYIRIAGT